MEKNVEKKENTYFLYNFEDRDLNEISLTEDEIFARMMTDIEKIMPVLDTNFNSVIDFLEDHVDYDFLSLPLYIQRIVKSATDSSELKGIGDFICIETNPSIDVFDNETKVIYEEELGWDISDFEYEYFYVSRSVLLDKLKRNYYILQNQDDESVVYVGLPFTGEKKKRKIKEKI